MERYFDLLCENSFTLVGTHNQSGYTGSWYEYALVRDGSDLATRKGIYTKPPCHIDVWYEDGDWRVEAWGESVQSGLFLSDSTYITDDGRLSATTAQSTVCFDGEAMTAAPALEKDSSGKYMLTLKGIGEEQLTVIWKSGAVQEGYSIFIPISNQMMFPSDLTATASAVRLIF